MRRCGSGTTWLRRIIGVFPKESRKIIKGGYNLF